MFANFCVRGLSRIRSYLQDHGRDLIMLAKINVYLGGFYDVQAVSFVGQLTEEGRDVKLSSLLSLALSHKQLRHFESARIIRRRFGGGRDERGGGNTMKEKNKK